MVTKVCKWLLPSILRLFVPYNSLPINSNSFRKGSFRFRQTQFFAQCISSYSIKRNTFRSLVFWQCKFRVQWATITRKLSISNMNTEMQSRSNSHRFGDEMNHFGRFFFVWKVFSRFDAFSCPSLQIAFSQTCVEYIQSYAAMESCAEGYVENVWLLSRSILLFLCWFMRWKLSCANNPSVHPNKTSGNLRHQYVVHMDGQPAASWKLTSSTA